MGGHGMIVALRPWGGGGAWSWPEAASVWRRAGEAQLSAWPSGLASGSQGLLRGRAEVRIRCHAPPWGRLFSLFRPACLTESRICFTLEYLSLYLHVTGIKVFKV